MSRRGAGRSRFLRAYGRILRRVVLGIPSNRSFNIPSPIIEKDIPHLGVRS